MERDDEDRVNQMLNQFSPPLSPQQGQKKAKKEKNGPVSVETQTECSVFDVIETSTQVDVNPMDKKVMDVLFQFNA